MTSAKASRPGPRLFLLVVMVLAAFAVPGVPPGAGGTPLSGTATVWSADQVLTAPQPLPRRAAEPLLFVVVPAAVRLGLPGPAIEQAADTPHEPSNEQRAPRGGRAPPPGWV